MNHDIIFHLFVSCRCPKTEIFFSSQTSCIVVSGFGTTTWYNHKSQTQLGLSTLKYICGKSTFSSCIFPLYSDISAAFLIKTKISFIEHLLDSLENRFTMPTTKENNSSFWTIF